MLAVNWIRTFWIGKQEFIIRNSYSLFVGILRNWISTIVRFSGLNISIGCDRDERKKCAKSQNYYKLSSKTAFELVWLLTLFCLWQRTFVSSPNITIKVYMLAHCASVATSSRECRWRRHLPGIIVRAFPHAGNKLYLFVVDLITLSVI
jgi:hypothetical protein